MINKKCGILICGAGIIGLTLARELIIRGYDDILIIEKEDGLGLHTSGRNSGVLHSGIYYTPDSIRAKTCLSGNRMMKEYCIANSLPLLQNGKVIVARNEEEKKYLVELKQRGDKNGAKTLLIDEKSLSEIEPNAKTLDIALYSPETAVVDPLEIISCLKLQLLNSGKVKIYLGTKFLNFRSDRSVTTNRGTITYEKFINCAGLYSDKVAHKYGAGLNYKIIPFKGIYKKLMQGNDKFFTNIYPVPDRENPFLGVHFTKKPDSTVYLGPTAMPALGRENYGYISGIDFEAARFLYMDLILFIKNKKFSRSALNEMKKYFFWPFFNDAKSLVRSLSPSDVISSKKSGIRPQLVDWNTKELVTDFIVIKKDDTIHVMNSISPAFTSSMEFAKIIADNYL